MFDLCVNASCPWACWCKRFTYSNSYPEILDECVQEYYDCPKGEKYIMNKARQIYERENPNDNIYDKFDHRKHEDNNRQPRLWEDDETDIDAETSARAREDEPGQDSVLQLQRSSDRRSNNPSPDFIEFFTAVLQDNIERYAVLQDTALNGIQTSRIEPGLPDDGTTREELF